MRLLAPLAAVTILALSLAGCAAEDDPIAGEVGESSDALSGSVSAGTKLVTTARLNFRASPSTSASILETLATGTQVTATGDAEAGFYQVDHAGRRGWLFGAHLERASDGSSSGGAPPAPGRRTFANATLLYQGDWSFLTRCDRFSQGRVRFACDESPTRVFVDEGAWVAAPSSVYSRSLCGDKVRVCKGSRCIEAVIVERSVTGAKWEGSSAVMRALGVDHGAPSCSNSWGTATGVTVTLL